LSQWLGKPIRRYTDITLAKQGKLNADAKEAVEGLPVIHAFGLSRMFTERFRILADDTLSSSLALERRKALLSPISIIAYGAPLLIGVSVGGRWVDSGLMSVSDILLFMYLLVFLIQPLALMPSLIGATNEMIVAVRRLREWMELPQEETTDEGADSTVGAEGVNGQADKTRRDGMLRERTAEAAGADIANVRREAWSGEEPAVVFDNVTLVYGEGPPVLKGISLSIPEGRTVAIVGPSGAGKSSIARLICGDQPVGTIKGDIRVFGRSVAQWPKEELRRHIALVAQEPFLFPVSIGDNISSGRQDSGQVSVIEAARLAHAHEFIERMPRGYETRLGERGAGLSRGERQRIAIARAIAKDAPLLLLDEASSALDPRSEALVTEAVQAYARGRTALIIAHRLSSIRLADEVLVLDEGRIVERGSYEELASEPGSRFMQLFGGQVAGQTAGVRLMEGGRSHVSVTV
uniref:ABC transporter ATP-binding protein n=1 Tax=Paenibacillus kobensis TaxID=59841 RepID=UPI0013E34598